MPEPNISVDFGGSLIKVVHVEPSNISSGIFLVAHKCNIVTSLMSRGCKGWSTIVQMF